MVGEDVLCCALGERIIGNVLPDWRLADTTINAGGITKLIPNASRYAEQAQHVQSVFCLADTDGKCPVELISKWRPLHASRNFVFRLAVTEIESWILADRVGFSSYFQISANKIPANVDTVADPKSLVLSLVAKSKKRLFRDEVVSMTDFNKRGSGYNIHLKSFVKTKWSLENARDHSISLRRAISNLIEIRHA